MVRLSGLDATFLYVETPNVHMHVSLLALFEPGPQGYDYERIHALIAEQARTQSTFQRRLMMVPLGVHHPVWVDDPHFDLVHHIKRIACPAPGSMVELAELCGHISSTPLDRSRPLWEIWVIEGLEQGRFALFLKVHHCLADGVAGAGMLASMFSLGPDAKPMFSGTLKERALEPLPTEQELLRDALRDRALVTKGFAKLWRRTSKAMREVLERRAQQDQRRGATPFEAPRVPWNAPITAERSVAFARIPMADLKVIRKAYGATVNDIVLAICAGALRTYLLDRSALPLAPLLAACPVSARSKTSTGQNQVTVLFTSLATNLEDPIERLSAIRATTRGAKEELGTFGSDLVGNWAELLAPAVFGPLTRSYTKLRLSNLHRPPYNVAISNVPGPPVPLYLSGARLTSAYPMGPVVEGVGLNITVMTYVDQVDFGFTAATSVLGDVRNLAGRIGPACDELLARATSTSSEQGDAAT